MYSRQFALFLHKQFLQEPVKLNPRRMVKLPELVSQWFESNDRVLPRSTSLPDPRCLSQVLVSAIDDENIKQIDGLPTTLLPSLKTPLTARELLCLNLDATSALPTTPMDLTSLKFTEYLTLVRDGIISPKANNP